MLLSRRSGQGGARTEPGASTLSSQKTKAPGTLPTPVSLTYWSELDHVFTRHAEGAGKAGNKIVVSGLCRSPSPASHCTLLQEEREWRLGNQVVGSQQFLPWSARYSWCLLEFGEQFTNNRYRVTLFIQRVLCGCAYTHVCLQMTTFLCVNSWATMLYNWPLC